MEVATWLFYEGAWDTAIATLCRIVDELTDRTALHLLSHGAFSVGELLRSAGRLDEAAKVLPGSLSSRVPIDSVSGRAALGLLSVELGNLEDASAHAAAARALMTDDDWLGLGARVRLVEALVALSTGDQETAELAFDQSIAAMRRVEHPWDEAEANYLFGKVLCERGAVQDGSRHLSSALELYSRVQAAAPFIHRVLRAWPPDVARPSATGVSETGSLGSPGVLSKREVQVLRLLAHGLTNRLIAAELVVSEPTVATHIRHILDKTGTANRAEAAAWAVRHRLA
jgi:DNA-binding CsgD family transcriptional regulator